MPVGPLEIVIVVLIALVVFGGKKLPQLGRSAGKGLRGAGDAADEFKDSVTGKPRAKVESGRKPSRADSAARSAGQSVREFKDSATGKESSDTAAGAEPSRTDAAARSAGQSVRDFKESVTGKSQAPDEGEKESIGQSAGRGLREFREALAGRDEEPAAKKDDAEVVQGEVVDRGKPPSDK